jgi:GH35 family endo-1,4-beta-xylanase
VGKLTYGNQYNVAVWVKLAAGTPDAAVTLTAKRQDDSDASTYSEFTNITTITASATEWRQLQGIYTQLGTAFQHFIIQSADTTASFYADSFSIQGDVALGVSPTHKFFVGNITTSGAVRPDFIQYWDQITPENEGKWASLEGTRDSYNWTALDRIYSYARDKKIPVKAHTFVWGSQYPNWISGLSAQEQAQEIEELMRDYCTRYPDTTLIDVVNEATPGHAPAAFAQSAFGNDWIIKSFQLARKHCPNAVLILNDYNVLSWDTDKFIAMARPAIDAGVVDAIGLQAHGLEGLSLATVTNNLNKVAALGVPIYITEYDVSLADDQAQLRVMKEQFTLFYNHPSVVGITLWGYVQGKTWVPSSGLISDTGTFRPAMTWLMNFLKRTTTAACDLPKAPQWESTAPLISAKNGAFGIKDPSIVQYNGKYHIWATINDGTWRSVYLNFTDWNQADAATQVPMTGTRVGNTVAPQIFYYRPHNLWYNFTQWGRGYSTTTDIENVNSWSARKDFLSNGPAADASKPELDYWVICDDANCHLFFSRDDGVLYKSKTTRANFPNFNGYSIVMEDHRGNGSSFLFEAPNVYKVDGTNQYLLTVEAYRTPGYGPRYFRSWTSTNLDGPWLAHADTEEAPFAGEANVTWPTGNKWATGISHGEMLRSGYDEYLTIDPCNMQFLYQGDSGTSLNGDYGGEPYKLGLIKLKQ